MHIDGNWFKDGDGRTLLLRGVNLGGSNKLPTSPPGETWRGEKFYDHRDVSFIGRPFPLEEADEHFGRIAAWGFTLLRLVVPWEAVEHAGPGMYDEDYLTYLQALLERANDYGIRAFIDPHQDAWSRWTGGDGAPGWTLEAVGMDLTKLYATGAAFTHQEHGDPYPRMVWPTNYTKLGAATMFTLFFAGDDLAPHTKIEGRNAREYLQGHFIRAFQHVAKALDGLPNVVGFDTLNEPLPGFIGVEDLRAEEHAAPLMVGPSPTPLQAMMLGAGHTVLVQNYELRPWGPQMTGRVMINEHGERLWRDDADDLWQANGVWSDKGGSVRVLRPYHFQRITSRHINFTEDYLKPFLLRFTAGIRDVQPRATIFIEGVPNVSHPTWKPTDPPNVAYAGHWYDNATLFLKFFRRAFNIEISIDGTLRPVIGVASVQELFNRQLAKVKQDADEYMSGIPTLIGEFGVPFDLNNKSAYDDGDFTAQRNALDMYYQAMEANLLNSTLWNYTADNTHRRGDLWNDEDLSIFSRDDQSNPADINSGGRALEAVVRPYPIATAGTPLQLSFDMETRVFNYIYKPDFDLHTPTVLYVPKLHYSKAYMAEGNHGLHFEPDAANARLYVTIGAEFADATVEITIAPDEDEA